MKALLVTLITCLSILNLSGQAYEVNWGPEQRKVAGRQPEIHFAESNGDTYQAVFNATNKPVLLNFDFNHHLLSKEPIDFGKRKKNFLFEGFYPTRSGNYGFFVELDKKKHQLRTHVSLFEGGSFGELRPVHTEEDYYGENLGGVYNIDYRNLYDGIVVSADESKVLVVNNLNDRNDNRKDKRNIIVFDENYEMLWEKEFSFGEGDDKIRLINVVVNNQGDVFVLAGVKREVLKTSMSATDYFVYQITPESDAIIKVQLEDDLLIQDSQLMIDGKENDELVVVGLYSDTEENKSMKGVYNFSISEEFASNGSNVFPFEPAFLEDINKKRRRLNINFELEAVFAFSDGTMGIVAEENYSFTFSNDHTSLHTDDLVIATFSPSGETVKMQKIEKNFFSGSPRTISFAIAASSDQLFLVYNDLKSSKESSEIGARRMGQFVTFTDLTIIDKNGEIVLNQPLFNSDATSRVFLTSLFNSNQSHMMFVTTGMSNYQCGLLPFTKND